MILAFCPGGVTSNLYTHLARGNLALSISLTSFVSLVTPFTVPLAISGVAVLIMGEGKSVDLPVMKTIATLVVITIVPVSIGMVTSQYKPKLAARLDRPLRLFSIVLLLLIVCGIVLENWSNLPSLIAMAGPATLCLNLLAMAVAFFLARNARLSNEDQKTITLEVGLQNGTTALFITSTLLADPVLSMPAAMYSLIMFVTGGSVVSTFSRFLKSTRSLDKSAVDDLSKSRESLIKIS